MRLVPLPGVFQPPSDSWLVVEQIRKESFGEGWSALDLCTGSGVLAIAAARHGAARTVAVDVSLRSVAAVRLNALLNGVRVKSVRGDLFEPVRAEQFDLIVSNPPYLPTPPDGMSERGLTRAWDGGPDGRRVLDVICARVAAHLRPGGVVLIVHSAVCGEQQSLEALAAHGLRACVAHRQRGRFGPLMQARFAWMDQQGVLPESRLEDMLVVRGERPVAASKAARGGVGTEDVATASAGS
jgi:release factor glutamine methyltransferase